MNTGIMQEALLQINDEFLEEMLDETVDFRRVPRFYIMRLLAAAACLALLVSAVQAYRYGYFKSGCGVLIGEIQNGTYYYVIPHRGLYAYTPGSGKQRILKSPQFDSWISAPQGICYSKGSKLMLYLFVEEESRLLCEFDEGTVLVLETFVDGDLGVTMYYVDGQAAYAEYLVRLTDGTRYQKPGIDIRRPTTAGTTIAKTGGYWFYIETQGSSPQNIYCYDPASGESICVLEDAEVYSAVTDGEFFYLCTPWDGGNTACYRVLRNDEGVPCSLELLEKNIDD